MAQQPLIFDNIDEPGLHTLEVYRRRGGYDALEEALKMEPDEVPAVLDAVRRGEEPLPERQLKRLKSADPRTAS